MLPDILKEKKIKSILIEKEEYFDVADIKKNHPDLKIDVSQVIIIKKVEFIKAEYVAPVSDFDNAIKNIFKPKK
ncbi:hypothetical protein FY557_19320 [Chryseobacterium sp. SN22]|uniref:hypothetical protein n=1 Tax=Chryseobacterium sp. SN22 TaxID=2606431 RepID=UPI0011EE66AA|nr:hypothetical protein [Chryseobacterium sp. SN22]KAA0126074.1 hypothetical protein FY557_19320 [Chryseobacterium sp. SN22]